MTAHIANEAMNKALLQAGREAVLAEGAAVTHVADQLDQTFISSIEMIESIDGKVMTIGAGTSGTVARRAAHLFSVSGIPSVFIHPMDALHGTMGAVQSRDLLLAFSKGGESNEINELCNRLKRRGVKVIAITERAESTLTSIADVAVCLHTTEGGDPGDVLAMGSTLVANAWCDALARAVMRKRHHTWEESLELHPAGAVGLIKDVPANLAPLALNE